MARPIVINARAAARERVGGVERWAREMAVRLPALRPDAYVVARPPRALAHRAGHVWEQAALPALAAGRRAALVYSPANLAPLAWPRNALLLHDVAALRHPEWYSPGYVRWQRRVVPPAARRARLLLTVSEFSRREIAEALDLDPAGIAVVAGGVDERFHPGADAPAAAAHLGLDRPYVLTLSTRYGRKNAGALDATARALAAEGVDLVAAGGERPYMTPGPEAPGVRALGYVPDDLLPGLFAGALAFVLPSREEGFGLPVLEAMASGTPVVAGDSGALPETAGGAARLADPDDAGAIAAAVARAAFDDGERERLRAAGLRRARTLTWERAARETDARLAAAAPREPLDTAHRDA
jgi:glycosyltransferase involved in cell wall biosynthesis